MPQRGYIYLQENKQIVIASSNKGKLKEFKKIFDGFEIISQSELGIKDAIEDGKTFFENALIKARNASYHSGIFSIADDSGLVVPELNFEPGIYSARYSGQNASDGSNRKKIIDELKKLNKEEAEAFYICALVGIRNYKDPIPYFSTGKIYGKVKITESGEGGFGYDKIFYPNDIDGSMASLNSEIKNKISHRAIATKSFMEQLNLPKI